MNIKLLTAVALVALAVAAGDEAPLRFKWRAGQEFKHQVRVEGQVFQDGAPLQKLSYRGLWVRRITEVDSNGEARFEATSENVQRSEGFWLYDFGGYGAGFETVGRIKPTGQVLSLDHAREGDPAYWSILVFPDQPVPIGGRWKYRPPAEQMTQQLGLRAAGEVTYQLLDRVRYKSRTCLKISRESRYQVGWDPNNEFNNVRIETRGTLWFDELVGNLVDAEMQEVYSAQLVRRGKEEPGQGEPPPEDGQPSPEFDSSSSAGDGKTHQISAKAKITFTLTR